MTLEKYTGGMWEIRKAIKSPFYQGYMTFHLYGGQGKEGGVIICFQDIPYYALRGFVVPPPTPAFP